MIATEVSIMLACLSFHLTICFLFAYADWVNELVPDDVVESETVRSKKAKIFQSTSSETDDSIPFDDSPVKRVHFAETVQVIPFPKYYHRITFDDECEDEFVDCPITPLPEKKPSSTETAPGTTREPVQQEGLRRRYLETPDNNLDSALDTTLEGVHNVPDRVTLGNKAPRLSKRTRVYYKVKKLFSRH